MRAFIPFAALAALAFAQSAAAATVTLAPVALSPEFQTTLQEDLGEREGAVLQDRVAAQVSRALAGAGAQINANGQLTVEVTIVDARPNRPTMQQLRNEPGLDWGRSVSTGGAELHGVIRGAGGQVLAEVDHDFFTPSLEHVFSPPGQWTDADRAIRTFANEVADAYAANAQ